MRNLLNAADRQALFRRLESVAPESTRRWGIMTPHQMICHLSDALRLSLDERPATGVGGLLEHTIIKWVVLFTPVTIPKGVPTTAELDQTIGGTAPVEFVADVQAMERLCERFVAGAGPIEAEHPAFGPLSRWQWGRFHYRHLNHHLRQFGA